MALEPLSTGLALREEFALSIEDVSRDGTPAFLWEYLEDAFVIELRILWENGAETRRLWIFRDTKELTRLSAAFNSNPLTWPPRSAPAGMSAPAGADASTGADGGEGEEINYGGYIEIYNAEGYIIGEHRLDTDRTERIIRFIYTGNTLLRAETRLRRPPAAAPPDDTPASDTAESDTVESAVENGAAERGAAFRSIPPAATDGGEWIVERYCTDYYYYSRSRSLRAVERVYHMEGAAEPLRLQFSHRMDQAISSIQFENPQSAVSAEFFEGIVADSGASVLYTTDPHGRVLTETRKNDEGEVTGELVNTWSGGKLESVQWVAGEGERRTEYEYNDAGDRIVERNYNGGMLERVVRQDGDKDIEELYMNNRVILRAIWEDGRKISEERIRGDAP
jgi:hypothetical protein